MCILILESKYRVAYLTANIVIFNDWCYHTQMLFPEEPEPDLSEVIP